MADATLDLFAPEPTPLRVGDTDIAEYRRKLALLADNGLFIGTSSWKYEGWRGMIYDMKRYLNSRSKFSPPRFEKECLGEYSQTFRSVCFDGAYYQFPSYKYLKGMFAQVPEGFQFAFKATEEVTIKRFPNVPRSGERAGRLNPNFLNAEMFTRLFLGPMGEFREKVGPLIFEFSTFSQADFEHGRDFIAALDVFLGQLPHGWKYGVEIRNKGWLQPEYFTMLKSHGVAHVYNNWTRMPPVAEQIEIADSLTADFTVCRFLLKPGRAYQTAVDQFQPYKEIRDRVHDSRGAIAKLLESSFELRRLIYIYINNRLEGSAPLTIAEIIQVIQIFEVLLRKQSQI